MLEEKEMELAEQISILIHDALDNVKKFYGYGVEDTEMIEKEDRRIDK